MFTRLKDRPAKELLGPPSILIAVGFCAWATVERGLFDGLVLLTGLVGVSLGLYLLPSRPRLTVEVRDQGGSSTLVVTQAEPVRPFDKDAIVNEQAELALASMPERPGSDIDENDTWQQATSKVLSASLQAALTGVSAEALEEFEGQVNSFRRILRAWFGQVERARVERLRVFKGELRIRELGRAAGDHIHLRLRFPEGFRLSEDLYSAGPPPDRPTFARLAPAWPNRERVIRRLDEFAARGISPVHAPGSDPARYSTEDGAPIIDYDLGRVNQSDHRDVAPFFLQAPGPGQYKIAWEASATGLEHPSKGILLIEVIDPVVGEPIASMAEAEAEYDKYDA